MQPLLPYSVRLTQWQINYQISPFHSFFSGPDPCRVRENHLPPKLLAQTFPHNKPNSGRHLFLWFSVCFWNDLTIVNIESILKLTLVLCTERFACLFSWLNFEVRVSCPESWWVRVSRESWMTHIYILQQQLLIKSQLVNSFKGTPLICKLFWY